MAETNRERKVYSLSSSPTSNLREYHKWIAVGKANYDKKRFHAAVEDFQNALKYQKNHADAWIFLGLSILENSPQEAIPYLKKGLNLQPDFARGYVGLGFAYQSLDRKAEAAQEYKKYLRIDPNGHYARELRTILMSLE
jgi:superkiller protein 3